MFWQIYLQSEVYNFKIRNMGLIWVDDFKKKYKFMIFGIMMGFVYIEQFVIFKMPLIYI